MILDVQVPCNFGIKNLHNPFHGNIFIQLRDGQKIKANSLILSFNGKNFERYFNDLEQKTLDIKDHTPKIVMMFLETLYGGDIEITDDIFREINSLSLRFEVKWLADRCESYFMSCVRLYLPEMECYWTNIFLFEEAEYARRVLKIDTFMDEVVKSLSVLPNCGNEFVEPYLKRNYLTTSTSTLIILLEMCDNDHLPLLRVVRDQLFTKVLDTSLKICAFESEKPSCLSKDLSVFTEDSFESAVDVLKEQSSIIVIDDTSRYLLQAIDLVDCHKKDTFLYYSVFEGVFKNCSNITAEDYDMMTKLHYKVNKGRKFNEENEALQLATSSVFTDCELSFMDLRRDRKMPNLFHQGKSLEVNKAVQLTQSACENVFTRGAGGEIGVTKTFKMSIDERRIRKRRYKAIPYLFYIGRELHEFNYYPVRDEYISWLRSMDFYKVLELISYIAINKHVCGFVLIIKHIIENSPPQSWRVHHLFVDKIQNVHDCNYLKSVLWQFVPRHNDKDLFYLLSAETTFNELITTKNLYKFKFHHPLATQCTDVSECGFVLKVTPLTAEDPDSFNIELLVNIYPPNIHCHPEILNVDEMHVVVEYYRDTFHNEGWRNMYVSWAGKPTFAYNKIWWAKNEWLDIDSKTRVRLAVYYTVKTPPELVKLCD